MAEETLELTEQEKQAVEKQRLINARVTACMNEVNAVLMKHNCYLATNGVVNIAGSVASHQIRIDITSKG